MCSAKTLLAEVCFKGVANSCKESFLASPDSLHPAGFSRHCYSSSRKAFFCDYCQMTSWVARHELAYPQKIQASILRTLLFLLTSSVLFSDKPEIVQRIWFNGKAVYEKTAPSAWSVGSSAQLESFWPMFPGLQLARWDWWPWPAPWEKLPSPSSGEGTPYVWKTVRDWNL